jgi:uncharacterized protein (TIGR00288 family)
MLERFRGKSAGEKKKGSKSIAVFVDGPNILRKELGIDLHDIRSALEPFGKIKIAKVFLNQFASDKLVEAVVNAGFESQITVGDIDVAMSVEAMEAVFNPNIGVVAFVSRDGDFGPAIVKAKRYGKDTVVVLADESVAASLKTVSDFVVFLKKTKG